MCYVWVIEINTEMDDRLCVERELLYLLERQLSNIQYLDEKTYFLTSFK